MSYVVTIKFFFEYVMYGLDQRSICIEIFKLNCSELNCDQLYHLLHFVPYYYESILLLTIYHNYRL